jgi:hypothetical protein
LKYSDNVALRQSVEKQLSHIEMMNRFAKAIFFGNNQDYQRGAGANYPLSQAHSKRHCAMELSLSL